jgi:hypothetical protein
MKAAKRAQAESLFSPNSARRNLWVTKCLHVKIDSPPLGVWRFLNWHFGRGWVITTPEKCPTDDSAAIG